MSTNDASIESVMDNIKGTRDALTVKKVFGDPYEVDGITMIPVARVGGGAGGGGGSGTSDDGAGTGFGTGFGMGAVPVGVYAIQDGTVSWQPALDVQRVVKGGQILTGLVAVCVTLVLLRRRR